MNESNPHSELDSSRDSKFVSRRSVLGGMVLCGAATGISQADEQPVTPDRLANPRLFTFAGGQLGSFTVTQFKTVKGESLAECAKLDIVNAQFAPPTVTAKWTLRGVTSNARYVEHTEKLQLEAKQALLGRREATCGALIPIRKSAEWWSLTQDERRAIFEDRSHHTATGLKYLPAIARRLHHCRDLENSGPFDFITLFDYAPADGTAFEELVGALRATEEWKFVDREIDIRFVRS